MKRHQERPPSDPSCRGRTGGQGWRVVECPLCARPGLESRWQHPHCALRPGREGTTVLSFPEEELGSRDALLHLCALVLISSPCSPGPTSFLRSEPSMAAPPSQSTGHRGPDSPGISHLRWDSTPGCGTPCVPSEPGQLRPYHAMAFHRTGQMRPSGHCNHTFDPQR